MNMYKLNQDSKQLENIHKIKIK